MSLSKSINFDEFDFLNLFYQKMLDEGQSYNITRLSVNNRMVEDIYDKSTFSLTEEYLKKMADICLANSWIEYSSLAGNYTNLRLTTTGNGVIKSKQMQKKSLESRSPIKRVSDYINDHSGLFLFGSFILLFASVLIAYLMMGSGNGK